MLCCLGPNTLVGLSKKEGVSRSDMVKRLLPAYSQVLKELKSLGVPEVQIHEPILTIADAASLESDFATTFAEFEKSGLYINLVTYYDDIGAAYPWTVKWVFLTLLLCMACCAWPVVMLRYSLTFLHVPH